MRQVAGMNVSQKKMYSKNIFIFLLNIIILNYKNLIKISGFLYVLVCWIRAYEIETRLLKKLPLTLSSRRHNRLQYTRARLFC